MRSPKHGVIPGRREAASPEIYKHKSLVSNECLGVSIPGSGLGPAPE